MKVARIASVPRAIVGYRKYFEELQRLGVEITIICNKDEDFPLVSQFNVSKFITVPIEREISLFGDLLSVWTLFKTLVGEKFDIVHSMTPKGGLLAAIAAYMAGVPVRFHTFTGQRWETLKGPKRSILIICDWIIGKLSTHCFADSLSQAEYLVRMGIVPKERISSIHKGSFAGVDFQRFNFEHLGHRRDENRKALGIARDDVVICFVGRIVRDKGIEELIDAFTTLAATNQELVLLLVGPVEELGNSISKKSLSIMRDTPRIISVGGVNNPEYYLSASDIFCLPSYREGFGTVILEAAALRIPTVATQITGIVDAIEDGKTGILVEPRNALSLGKALSRLINDSSFRQTLGKAAYERAFAFYRTETLVEKTLEAYNSALNRDRRSFLK